MSEFVLIFQTPLPPARTSFVNGPLELIIVQICMTFEVPSLITSKFSLYFSGSCIPINPKLSFILALLTLPQIVQNS
jgi:hypothetical protein